MRMRLEEFRSQRKSRRASRKPNKSTSTSAIYLPTEAADAHVVWQWATLHKTQYPDLEMLFHVPNEAKRSVVEGRRLKQAGLVPGIPDWFLDVPRGGFHGLRIEQKRKGGKLTQAQATRLDLLNKHGYMAVLCVGADAVIDTIKSYLAVGQVCE